VPLGISSFRAHQTIHANDEATPLMWGSAAWNIAWVKRHQRPASIAAWEAPDLLILDMREYFHQHAAGILGTRPNANPS
jgi:hypothetical protein